MAQTQNSVEADLPRQIRVSVGTAIVIGLLEGKLDAEPTTAYLMTYNPGKCRANCAFCPQARDSHSNAELLSRITWPRFPTITALKATQNAAHNRKIRRVCIQALNYPNVIQHLVALTKTIKYLTNIPISVSCQPQNRKNIQQLAYAGADRIGIAIDAATPKIFNQTKGTAANGPYTWQNTQCLLKNAVDIFGKNRVTTHLIIGLGETEKQAATAIQKLTDQGIQTALFAFTPVHGTPLQNHAQPKVEAYRRIQLARHLITKGLARSSSFIYDKNSKITDYGIKKTTLQHIINTGTPFLTTGCPDCNRPYYNEKPTGPIYNHPKSLTAQETAAIKTLLKLTRLRQPSAASPSQEASASDGSLVPQAAKTHPSCNPSTNPS